MPDFFYFLLMLFAGVSVALQPLINANLAARVGVIQSSFISFFVGALALGAVVLVARNGTLRALPGTPWWQLTGGLLGALFVTTIILAVPRIGTLAALSAAIATQLATGAVLDHFGLLGGRHIPLDTWRVAGIALLFAGAGMVFKG
jgi:transporter family-2 protein